MKMVFACCFPCRKCMMLFSSGVSILTEMLDMLVLWPSMHSCNKYQTCWYKEHPRTRQGIKQSSRWVAILCFIPWIDLMSFWSKHYNKRCWTCWISCICPQCIFTVAIMHGGRERRGYTRTRQGIKVSLRWAAILCFFLRIGKMLFGCELNNKDISHADFQALSTYLQHYYTYWTWVYARIRHRIILYLKWEVILCFGSSKYVTSCLLAICICS